MPASALPSQVPKRGRNGYVTPKFLGVPNPKRGEKIRRGYIVPFVGPQKRAE